MNFTYIDYDGKKKYVSYKWWERIGLLEEPFYYGGKDVGHVYLNFNR